MPPTKTQQEVHYRLAKLGTLRRCGTCSMYVKGMKCTLVKGIIVPAGDCDKYEEKEGPK